MQASMFGHSWAYTVGSLIIINANRALGPRLQYISPSLAEMTITLLDVYCM